MGQYQHTSATLDLMRVSPVIPVLTMKDAADGIAQAKALVAGGLRVLEVTLRTAGALEAIAAIAKSVPGAIVGAGTVTEPAHIQASIDAGATFLVSPGVSPKLREAAADSPIPFLPGIATASEAMALMDYGFRALKFFPAEAAGGAKYLSSIAGPLSQLTFCPTGGIDLAKAPTYLALKNVACVGGSWMVPKSLIDAGDWEGIEKLAREAANLKAS
ncbi:bifunctional 4-hydroxy-2-oxoglutarate aldolase/2-dehydro-3-deoxy-phosphogluconate aldolase [Methylovirgula sp. 4M-Z18]|uniref:bifunctional 4-hydroxy-2-oxoglutarate aldolase/2-dehydro-3-deoxy-phosphogluconate aldolase n=2 Tax=Methylovirgula sp. 4M-Z18 TaxID=2293567 RepID=UPI00247AD2ED|nr:bifunctional 4-hydroxy-2-oxoglutarate aldolase/2-dehydro-3-deoxy-phosphogluconate aldolase [Methylovirgula sp. 4M-Z18]